MYESKSQVNKTELLNPHNKITGKERKAINSSSSLSRQEFRDGIVSNDTHFLNRFWRIKLWTGIRGIVHVLHALFPKTPKHFPKHPTNASRTPSTSIICHNPSQEKLHVRRNWLEVVTSTRIRSESSSHQLTAPPILQLLIGPLHKLKIIGMRHTNAHRKKWTRTSTRFNPLRITIKFHGNVLTQAKRITILGNIRRHRLRQPTIKQTNKTIKCTTSGTQGSWGHDRTNLRL